MTRPARLEHPESLGSTRGLAAAGLMTQLEMTTSAWPFGQRDVVDPAVHEDGAGDVGLRSRARTRASMPTLTSRP